VCVRGVLSWEAVKYLQLLESLKLIHARPFIVCVSPGFGAV